MKKVLINSIPFILALLGQISSIQQILGINGSMKIGLLAFLLVSIIPLILALKKYLGRYLNPFPEEENYVEFIDSYISNAQNITFISSGTDQVRDYFETMMIKKSLNNKLEVHLYVRGRIRDNRLDENLKRLVAATKKNNINLRIFVLNWEHSNLGAVIIDNKYAALNFYFRNKDITTRVWKKYKIIERGKFNSHDEMFLMIDKWQSELKINYSEITNEYLPIKN
jgi:hypothetical protein